MSLNIIEARNFCEIRERMSNRYQDYRSYVVFHIQSARDAQPLRLQGAPPKTGLRRVIFQLSPMFFYIKINVTW